MAVTNPQISGTLIKVSDSSREAAELITIER
jgi:hypothetical protein